MNTREFVNKWLKLFSKQRAHSQIYEYDLEEDLNLLGYDYNPDLVLDKTYANINYLEREINNIDSADVLAATLIERWRYYTQDVNRDEIYKTYRRKWLRVILERFKELGVCKEFDGKITNISVTSKRYIENDFISNNREIGTQIIEIFEDGEVQFKIFDQDSKYLDSYADNISKELTEDIFNTLKCCFIDNKGRIENVTNNSPGYWMLTLEDNKGHNVNFTDEMNNLIYLNEINISDYLRENLNFDDLWLFDYGRNINTINSIELIVRHIARFNEEECERGKLDNVVVFNESFYINRKNQTITHLQGTSEDINVSTIYRLNGIIDSLLDTYYDCPFTKDENHQDDYAIDDKLDREYKLIINRLDGNSQTIEGKYYVDDLALGLKELIDNLSETFEYFNISPSLLDEVYNKPRRKKNELVCVGVFLDENQYDYYLADNDITEGMMVVVPVEHNKKAIGEVDEVLYLTRNNLPKPYREFKKIIRICNEDDLKQLN